MRMAGHRASAGLRTPRPPRFSTWVIAVFDTITDYLVLAVYLSAGLGFPKREVYRATTSYASLTDELRSRVPARAFDRIAHTDNRAKVRRPEAWVRAT